VDRDRPHLAPDPDPWSTLVYAARGSDVTLTMVDGEVLSERSKLIQIDHAEVVSAARAAAKELNRRAAGG
jgi:5-methylthioadenosine/S-adenosylhomocysteine deaminase